jgi:hypothetical protein
LHAGFLTFILVLSKLKPRVCDGHPRIIVQFHDGGWDVLSQELRKLSALVIRMAPLSTMVSELIYACVNYEATADRPSPKRMMIPSESRGLYIVFASFSQLVIIPPFRYFLKV